MVSYSYLKGSSYTHQLTPKQSSSLDLVSATYQA